MLDTIIKEDDLNGEVWYLLAFSHYNLRKYRNATECIGNAFECKDITPEFKEASTELLAKLQEEAGITGDTTVSEEIPEDPLELEGEDEEYSEEDISDDDMPVDNDVDMQ